MLMMKFQRLPFIAYLCILPFLVSLGIWQLNRAEEKRKLIALQENADLTEISTLKGEVSEDFQAVLYKNINMIGRFDGAHQFLLDNRIYQGRAGYFVLTPLLLSDSKKAVLINRGWLPAGGNRSETPEISVDNTQRNIKGRINRFPSVGIKLEGAEIPTKTYPALVQVVDVDVLSRQLGYELLPFQVELDKSATDGYIREWRNNALMPPEKHIAYAVQWFSLALTLTFLLVKYGRHTANDKPQQ